MPGPQPGGPCSGTANIRKAIRSKLIFSRLHISHCLHDHNILSHHIRETSWDTLVKFPEGFSTKGFLHCPWCCVPLDIAHVYDIPQWFKSSRENTCINMISLWSLNPLRYAQDKFKNLSPSWTAPTSQILYLHVASYTCYYRIASHCLPIYSVPTTFLHGKSSHTTLQQLDRGLHHTHSHSSTRLSKQLIVVHVFLHLHTY